MEVKVAQWRGGVWVDPQTGVHWLVVAGLAKGNHEDHDDFYVRVQAENAGSAPQRWLPTDQDQRLLKRETAARLITEWELVVQVRVLEALRGVHTGGTAHFAIDHPLPGKGVLATLTLTVNPVREPDYNSDDIVVEKIRPPVRRTTAPVAAHGPGPCGLESSAGGDRYRYRDTYSNIAEPGSWTVRIVELEKYVERHELVEPEPGQHCHYTHREHIAGSAIEGSSVRALCGVYFVPCRDHTDMPVCPECPSSATTLCRSERCGSL